MISEIIMIFFWFILAYVIGSFPTAYLAGKWLRGMDIRRYGSGNVGGVNVWESVAWWAIVPVGLVDVGKGVLAVGGARWLNLSPEVQAAAGLAAICGHNWSLFLRFSGGRGIATLVGVLLLLAPREVVVMAMALIGGKLMREVALGCGLGALALPLVALALREPPLVVWACVGMTIIVFAKRLISNPGTVVDVEDWKSVVRNRLLFDRDISDKEAWVHRAPSENEQREMLETEN